MTLVICVDLWYPTFIKSVPPFRSSYLGRLDPLNRFTSARMI